MRARWLHSLHLPVHAVKHRLGEPVASRLQARANGCPPPALGESRRNNELPGRDCLAVGRRGGGGGAVVAGAFSHVEEGDTSRAEKKNDRRSSVSPLLGVLPRRANEVLDFAYSRKPLLPLPSFFLRR